MESDSIIPFLWVMVSLIVTGVGCGAAILGWYSVVNEKKKVEQAKAALTPEAAWEGGHSINEHSMSKWLNNMDIPPGSCIGDYIRTCWSAWLGNRSASLSELHSLVSRREKVRMSARLSGGIAALLLVIGIIGTLSSVHPILESFQFRISSNGELEDAAASTALVNALINNLGGAFLPSLWALGGTIFVVTFRGGYLHGLHKLTLELDDFALSTLLPKYRIRSAAEEYKQVKKVLSDLSDGIVYREDNFEAVVTDLKKLVEGINPAMKTLKASAVVTEAASEKLSARTKSISDGISRNLGKNSPMFKAVSGFEGIFERTEASMNTLNETIQAIGESSRKDREGMTALLANFEQSVRVIKQDHASDRNAVGETVSDFKDMITAMPEKLVSVGESTVLQGIEKLQSGLESIKEENEKSNSEALSHLNVQASAMREEMNQAADRLPEQLDRVEKMLSSVSAVEKAAIASIGDLAGKTSLQMVAVTAEAKSLEKIAEESLRKQGEESASVVRSAAADAANSLGKTAVESIRQQTEESAKTIRSVASDAANVATQKLAPSISRLESLTREVSSRKEKTRSRKRWYWPFGK